MSEVLCLCFLVGQALLMAMQYDVVGGDATRDGILAAQVYRLGYAVQGGYVGPAVHLAAQLDNGPLAHTIYNQVGPRVAQNTWQ